MKLNCYKYKAILFDFDGTLFDTWPGIALALRHTYKHYTGLEIGNIDHLKSYSVLPRADLLAKVFATAVTGQQIDHYIGYYKEIMMHNIVPYQGVELTIATLQKSKIPWGIVTNKPKEHMTILAKHIKILNSASCIICPEDVQYRKPHAEPLLKACSMLNVTVNDALYIGDTALDIEAANNCKMDCALALYGYVDKGQLCAGHKLDYFVYEDLAEIIAF